MDVTTKSLPAVAGRVPSYRETLRVRGRQVDVLTLGSGDPLVFLHGFGANPDIYLRSLVALARRNRHVIAPTLPSFGKSDPLHVEQQNVRGVAEHMVATLHQYDPDLGPVDFVGHSFGGGVSLRIAATHPEMVKSLTLICPVGGAGQGASGVGDVVRGILAGDAGAHWLFNGYRHFIPAFVKHAPSVVAAGLAAWHSDQIEDVATVDRLGIPVRFLFANRDRLVRPGAIPSLASANVHVEIQDGRHSWLIGEPERFVEAVLGPLPAVAIDPAA